MLFTVLPSHVWPGTTDAVFDLGIYYGPYGRTFFPSGWLPGNAFARIIPEHFERMKQIGRSLLEDGAQDVTIAVREQDA
ncbi:hypothetical protein BOO71_0010297 [Deinococcus marmoris]|uniref:Uncharacterized protein n=1 Tax=Deinococcus marmoris TaxID=249408 RepID=A0A1U7NVH4_9DEIO|nr:hypothetical protein BOO71_0010297 [Deinococcus marmoris]